MKKHNIALLAYDFPHKKTEEFIRTLVREKYEIEYVIGNPWQKLPVSQVSYSFTSRTKVPEHPAILCKSFDILYLVSDHNSPETIAYIQKNPVEVHVISGARILNSDVISACKDKILNIHPGLLPEMRGLDTLLWSIYYDIPIGITAHFISDKVDKGRCVYQEQLTIYISDTIEDVFERLMSKQSKVLIKALEISEGEDASLLSLDRIKSEYHSAMPSEFIPAVLSKFPEWRETHFSST